MSNYNCTAVDAADNVEHIVVLFKLLERPGTFDEAALAVAELTELIVTPEEKRSVLEASQCMATATTQVVDMQRTAGGGRAIIQF